MPKSPWMRSLCGGVAIVFFVAGTAFSGELGERLLPKTTCGYVAVRDVPELVEYGKQTQIGKLLADPAMEPAVADLRKQIESRVGGLEERFGLTFSDLEDVPSGELAIGVSLIPSASGVDPTASSVGLILLVDVTGQVDRAQLAVNKAAGKLLARGARQSRTNVGAVPVAVFDVPSKFQSDPPRRVVYAIHRELLIAASNLRELAGVLARQQGTERDCLADRAGFKAVTERCKKDIPGFESQIHWYIDPMAYGEVTRAVTDERDRPKGKGRVAIAREQGFDGIRAVGGFIDIGVNGYELLHRTAVHSPEPHTGSMKMISTPNRTEFTPQDWVPREIATYATGYFDILNAFDNFGPLFDELFGQGEEEVWEQVLEGLETDPYGPRIDLRGEMIERLGDRITVLTNYNLPITTTSERVLIAIEVNDEPALARALSKLFKNDEEVRAIRLGKHIIWEALPREKTDVPTVRLGSIPPLGGDEMIDDEEEVAEPFFPNTSITVARGHLLVASHRDFLRKILTLPENHPRLADDVEFRMIEATALKLGPKEGCLRTFSRTDETYRSTYELIRQGKMPESETLLGRILNTVFGANRTGEVREQEIDGRGLPEYDLVRRYLGPAGLSAVDEPDGLFLKGFTLKKP